MIEPENGWPRVENYSDRIVWFGEDGHVVKIETPPLRNVGALEATLRAFQPRRSR